MRPGVGRGQKSVPERTSYVCVMLKYNFFLFTSMTFSFSQKIVAGTKHTWDGLARESVQRASGAAELRKWLNQVVKWGRRKEAKEAMLSFFSRTHTAWFKGLPQHIYSASGLSSKSMVYILLQTFILSKALIWNEHVLLLTPPLRGGLIRRWLAIKE